MSNECSLRKEGVPKPSLGTSNECSLRKEGVPKPSLGTNKISYA